MATAENVQKLQQDLQNELTHANQLLRLISHELQKIKSFTSVGSEFESTIKQNTSLTGILANILQINITNLPPVPRAQLDNMSQDESYNQHDC